MNMCSCDVYKPEKLPRLAAKCTSDSIKSDQIYPLKDILDFLGPPYKLPT